MTEEQRYRKRSEDSIQQKRHLRRNIQSEIKSLQTMIHQEEKEIESLNRKTRSVYSYIFSHH